MEDKDISTVEEYWSSQDSGRPFSISQASKASGSEHTETEREKFQSSQESVQSQQQSQQQQSQQQQSQQQQSQQKSQTENQKHSHDSGKEDESYDSQKWRFLYCSQYEENNEPAVSSQNYFSCTQEEKSDKEE
jgi:hypothetical protein